MKAAVHGTADSSVAAAHESIDCKHVSGVVTPVINRNRCEGKQDCVQACPYSVFRIDIVPREERGDLTLLGRLKGFAHGWRQAYAINAEACRGCGQCVSACPEQAITLTRVRPATRVDA